MKLPNLPGLPNISKWFPSFGGQLHNYRTLRGLTIEQVAEAIQVSPQALRDIESGKRSAPPKDVVVELADLLRLRKEEREMFLDSAEMGSPVIQALQGKLATPTDHPALSAAILVFLIADIRGYTHFTVEHGDEAAARLTQHFAHIAHDAVERHDGHLIETRGDEILAVFASARQALRAAQVLQARCSEEAAAHADLPLYVGVGLDVGEAVAVDGGGYRGVALNRAARLCSLAGAGEVLVSTGVVYLAPQVEGMTFVARGQEQLKGFDGPTPILLAAPTPLTHAEAVIEASAAPLAGVETSSSSKILPD